MLGVRPAWSAVLKSVHKLPLLKTVSGSYVLLSILFVSHLHATDTMYRCDDGSFTNRADAGCPAYQPQGVVTTSPDGQPPSAIRDRLIGDTTVMTAILPPPGGKAAKAAPTLCALFNEWQTLRRTTNNGTVLARKRDFSRWQALSRLFADVGMPQCAVPSSIQSAQSRP